VAKDNGNEEAFASISAIIQREHQQDFWRQLNFVTGKKGLKAQRPFKWKAKVGQLWSGRLKKQSSIGFSARCITSGTL
jgi:hypothetical protein